MGVHDTGAAFLFESILVILGQAVVESGDVRPCRRSIPIIYIRPARVVVGHNRAHFQRVDVRKNKIAAIGDFLLADIAPEVITPVEVTAKLIPVAETGETIV